MSPSEVNIGDFVIPTFDVRSRLNSDDITLIKDKKYTIIGISRWLGVDYVILSIAGENETVRIRYNENTHKSYHIFSIREERLEKLKQLL